MDPDRSEEEQEYASSDEQAEKEANAEGPTKRPQMITTEFKEHLCTITRCESKHLRPTLLYPNFQLSTAERHAGVLYLAPPTFLWDPTVYGVQVKCPEGNHKLHKSDWRDQLAFDFAGPIYLRRRLMKCQKPGCGYNGHSYVVQDEGLAFYPFHHTDKRVLTKKLHDFFRGFSLREKSRNYHQQLHSWHFAFPAGELSHGGPKARMAAQKD